MENHFRCLNCKKEVVESSYQGTSHRNHCPWCLWSRHVDENNAGDRKSFCKAKMEPVGLTFKNAEGELMLIHRCANCGKISINRIAGDDSEDKILEIFSKSKNDEKLRQLLSKQNIKLLGSSDEKEIKSQLFGK